MLINLVSKHYHISTRTLRYYEEIGLIKSTRNHQNKRLYDATNLKRLEDVLLFKSLGFKLQDIQLVLEKPDELRPILFKSLHHIEEELLDYSYKRHKIMSVLKTYGSDHFDKRTLQAVLEEQVYVKEERWLHMQHKNNLTLLIGTGLVPLCLKDQEDNMITRIKSLRTDLESLHKISLDPIRIKDVNHLKEDAYQVLVGDEVLYEGEVGQLTNLQQLDHIITHLKGIILG